LWVVAFLIFENKKNDLVSSSEMPGVQFVSIRVVLSHVREPVRASMFDEGFRRSVPGVIVVEVEPNLLEAKIVDVGQGTTPQVR